MSNETETTPAQLLAKIRTGKPFSLSPAEQRILEGALAQSLGEKISGDDPQNFPGRPDAPKRLDESLFKAGESARRQSVPEAMDDDDLTDAINEIHAMLQFHGVPPEIVTACMNKLRDWAQGAPPGMNKHSVLKDGEIETHIIGDAALRPFRGLFANLPRVHVMGDRAAEPATRPVSADTARAAADLAVKLVPHAAGLRRV